MRYWLGLVFVFLSLAVNAQDSTLQVTDSTTTTAVAAPIENYFATAISEATASPSFSYLLVWALVFLLIGVNGQQIRPVDVTAKLLFPK